MWIFQISISKNKFKCSNSISKQPSFFYLNICLHKNYQILNFDIIGKLHFYHVMAILYLNFVSCDVRRCANLHWLKWCFLKTSNRCTSAARQTHRFRSHYFSLECFHASVGYPFRLQSDFLRNPLRKINGLQTERIRNASWKLPIRQFDGRGLALFLFLYEVFVNDSYKSKLVYIIATLKIHNRIIF